MLTVVSYVVLLSIVLISTLFIYLALLKIRLI